MAKVRRATPDDLDALVDMAAALHAEAPSYRDEPFEPRVVRGWLTQRMAAGTLLVDDSAVFVAERAGQVIGVLVSIVCDRWFNSRRFAAELTLYVKPEHRGGPAFPRLVQAFERWAQEQGAATTTLGVSTGIHAGRTVHAYEHLGYTLDGHNATKKL